MEHIILIGGGGHSKVVIDAIKTSRQFDIYGILDSKSPKGTHVLGVKVIGSDVLLPQLFKKGIRNAFISIGSIGDCRHRKMIYNKLKKIGFSLPVIIHQKAVVAKDVHVEEGAFVAAGAVINPGTKIGRNTIINTSASIDHDCVIGDFVHVAPGVTLSGGVRVGGYTHIGTGANVIQYIKIGKCCMISAGAVVYHNIRDGQKRL